MRVRSFSARVVLNSKAEPTLEVCVNGHCSSPPSGTSRGSREVKPWPDAEDTLSSVKEAARFASSFLKDLGDVDPLSAERELYEKVEELGGNTVLAISTALYKAAAAEEGIPLHEYLSKLFSLEPRIPPPLENVIGGGKHGGGSDIQEFLLFPKEGENPEDWIFTLSEVYRELKNVLGSADPTFTGSLTLESAWVTSLPTERILSLLRKVADEHGLGMGVDVAASDMYREGAYHWEKEGIVRDREAQMDYIEELANTYELDYIEDPLHEDDVEGFQELQKRVKGKIVGDDLFVTQAERLVPGVGGVIIKYNQVGAIFRAVEAVKRARELGMWVVPSHRSGETEDPFLSHFAVAVGGDLFKAGAAGIRIVKLNEVLRIYSSLRRRE
ncbi:MAG: hypothetical protein GXO00_02080 [Candidatus Diapherotrites archaeon]|nr:hypothetical protein [Candidatus Diapherotrites archaeon]